MEVDDLLEGYRPSHQNSQSHSALGTSSSLESQAKSQSKAPTDKVNTTKGKKRPAEEAPKQKQKGEKEEGKEEVSDAGESPSDKR